ncbi:hypothetical protein [Shinella sp. M31]|uniref:hypothetical protein n=1 Tax=Shinella sp. M31 TaxID=3368615 RepID=UPI003BA291F6
MEGVTRYANSYNSNGLGFSNGITEDENGGYVRYDAYQALALQVEAMKRRAEAAEALAERLKLEAQAHAMEARTANTTINEIYQVVSGGKGEPGNWNGAAPVREFAETFRSVLSDFIQAHIDGPGLLDCMDNAGNRYTSRFLADAISRARPLIQGEKP